MEKQRIIQVEENVPFQFLVPLSIQHMFAMFGASVLVPAGIVISSFGYEYALGGFVAVGFCGCILSHICSFVGKHSMLISTIPGPVIGGISFLLYSIIGTSGLRILVDSRVDYDKSRNLTLTYVIFVTYFSGIALKIGNIQMTGMIIQTSFFLIQI